MEEFFSRAEIAETVAKVSLYSMGVILWRVDYEIELIGSFGLGNGK